MNRKNCFIFLCAVFAAVSAYASGNTDAGGDGSRYSYAGKAGWFNWNTSYSGVTVSTGYLSGYLWQENVGWVHLGTAPANGVAYSNASPSDYGVNRSTTTGRLSGYAWGENIGWINFAPDYGGVAISTTGVFGSTDTVSLNGWVWSESIGWICFSSAMPVAYGVRTSALPPRPTNVYGIPDTTAITWRWTDNSSGWAGEDGFNIWSATVTNLLLGTTNQNCTAFKQTGLTPNTSYQIFVQPFNTAWSSALSSSSVASWVTEANFPAGLLWRNLYASSATITWRSDEYPENPGYTEYRVEVSSLSYRNEMSLSSTTVKSCTSATVSGLLPNTTYYGWVIAATLNNGPSPGRQLGNCRATLVSTATTANFGVVTSTSIQMTWGSVTPDNPAGTGYRVDLSTAADFSGPVYSSSTTRGAGSATPAGQLLPNTTYYARLIATNWERVSSTIPLQGIATLVSPPPVPVGAAAEADRVSMTWGAVTPDNPADTAYTLQVSSAGDFSGMVYSTATLRSMNGATVNGLLSNTTYYGRIVAANRAGIVAVSTGGVIATLSSPPGVAANTFTAIDSSRIQVNWAWNTDAGAKYYAECSAEPGFGATAATSGWTSGLNWLAEGLSINTSYYFRVKAQATTGAASGSSWTVFNSTWTGAVQTSAPQAVGYDDETSGTSIRVVISSAGSSGVNPAWTEYAIINTNTGGWLQGDGSTGTVKAWRTKAAWETGTGNCHTGLAPSSSYSYRVVSRNGSGIETAISAPGTAVTPGGPPANVQVVDADNDRLKISWDASPTALTYNVYWSTATDGTWTPLATGVGTTWYFDDTDGAVQQVIGVTLAAPSTYQMTVSWDAAQLLPGATRYYRVSSVGVGGESRMGALGTGARFVTPVAVNYKIFRDDAYVAIVSTESLAYIDGGLLPNTSYSYTVSGISSDGIESSSSTPSARYTLAAVPASATLSDPTTYSMRITLNPSDNPVRTVYSIAISSDDWSSFGYVQEDGIFGAGAVWQRAADWTNTIYNSGANLRYRVTVQARNGDGIVTSSSAETSKYSLANEPVAGAFGTVTSTGISANWFANANPDGTEYRCSVSTVPGGSCIPGPWTGTLGWVASNLSGNTSYYFQVRARNHDNVETSTAALGWKWTCAAEPAPPVLSSGLTDNNFVDVTISTSDGNPACTQYAVYGGNAGEYNVGWLQGDGSVGAGLVWKTKAEWETGNANRHKNLSSSTQYQYRVRARNGELVETGDGAYASVVTLPPRVTLISANEMVHDYIRVTWVAVENASYYRVFASSAADGVYVSLSSTTLTYYDDDLDGSVPVAPAGLNVTAISSTTLRLEWDMYTAALAPSTTRYYRVSAMTTGGEGPQSEEQHNCVTPVVTSYKIYKNGEYLASNAGGNTTGYIDTALLPDTSAAYTITVVSSDGFEGPASDGRSRWTLCTVPGTPVVNGDWDVTNGYHADITVVPNGNSVQTRYAVTVSSGGYGNWWVQPDGSLGTTPAWSTSATVINRNLASFTSYYYETQAMNGDGTVTLLSGPGVGFTPPMPGPQGFSISTRTVTSIFWTWTDPTDDEIAFRVYSSTGGPVSGDIAQNTTWWQETHLSSNTLYTRYVRAVSATGTESYASNSAAFYTLMADPAGLDFSGVYPSSIAVSNAIAVPNIAEGNSGARFTNVTNAAGSGWIQANGWTSTGLSPNTRYGFRVRWRNGDGIETNETPAVFRYTLANVPGVPALYNPRDTSFDIIINDAGNPDSTVYSIRVSTPGGSVRYAQNMGTYSVLGTTPDYETKAAWNNAVRVTGLFPVTTYYVAVDAENGDGVTTSCSLTAPVVTGGYAPLLVSERNDNYGYYIRVVVNAGDNPANTLYALLNVDSMGWLDGNGAVKPGETYRTKTQWEDIPVRNAHVNLSAGTRYTYMVRAKDPVSGNTVDSVQVSTYTLGSGTGSTDGPDAPGMLTVEEINHDYLKLTWSDVNGAVRYNVYYSTCSNGALHLLSCTDSLTCNDNIDGGYPEKILSTAGVAQSSTAVSLSWARAAAPADSEIRYYKVAGVNNSGTAGPASGEVPGQVTPVIAGYKVYRNTVWSGTVSSATVAFTDTNLTPDTTCVYRIAAVSSDGREGTASDAVSVQTFPRDVPPPGEVAGIKILSMDGVSIRIGFSAVTTCRDGSSLQGSLRRYNVYRGTTVRGPWTRIGIIPAQATRECSDIYNGQLYYYCVRAEDIYNQESEGLMIVTTAAGLVFSSEDCGARMEFDDRSKDIFYDGNDVKLTIERNQSDDAGTLAAYRVRAFNKSGQELNSGVFSADGAGAKIVLYYGSGTQAQKKSATESDARPLLYWNGGAKWVKIGGELDAANAVIWTRTKLLGIYEVRTGEETTRFALNGVEPKIFSPNESNPVIAQVRFHFDNPRNSKIDVRIYDREGCIVKGSLPDDSATELRWDGRDDGGHIVRNGVYIYQIEAEGHKINGTIVVAK